MQSSENHLCGVSSVAQRQSTAAHRGTIAWRKIIRRNMLFCATFPALALTTSGNAGAQDAVSEAGASSGLEVIVVTVRKREESLLDVPVAVSAVSSQKIQDTGVKSITEIADFTPGLTSQGQGAGGLPDRSANRLVFRGLSTSLGTIFINGAPYTANNSPDIGDLERFEVLTGPQSVYFGRSTFSGAVNLVTKTPSEELQARLSAEGGTDGLLDLRGIVEGALIPGVLTARLSVRHYEFGGQYLSAVSRLPLGEESSDSISLALAGSPSDNLDFSLFYTFSSEEDSHPEAAKLQTFGTTPLLDCDLGGTSAYFCGELPGVSGIDPAQFGDNIIVSDQVRAVLIDNALDVPGFGIGPSLDHFGLKRNIHHVNGRFDYETDSGWQMSLLASYTSSKISNIRALVGRDTSDLPNPFFMGGFTPEFVQLAAVAQREVNDIFGEIRVSTPQSNRLRATLGASYFEVYGPASVGMLITNIGPLPSTFDGGLDAGVRTPAVFGGLYFDLTDELTISAEARYQFDKVSQQTVFPVEGPFLENTFESFSPRVTIDYKVTPDHLLYATFSQGYKPGGFNPVLPTLEPLRASQVPPGFNVFFEEERLNNYEIGHKGSWFDGKLRTTLAVYHMQLTDGQVSVAVFLPGPPETPVTLVNNVGKIDLWGAEFGGDLYVNENFRISGTVDFNDNEIKESIFSDGFFIQGSTDVTGNMLDHVSKWRFSLSPVFTFNSPLGGDISWRLDWLYRSKWFVDNSNSAFVGGRHLVNTRLSWEVSDSVKFEIFIMNLFNDDTFPEALRAPETLYSATPPALTPVITPTSNTIFLELPDRRRGGAKFTVNF